MSENYRALMWSRALYCLSLVLSLSSCSKSEPEPAAPPKQEVVSLTLDHVATGAIASMLDIYIDAERAFDSIASMFVLDEARLVIHWMQSDGTLIEQPIRGHSLRAIFKERSNEMAALGVRCLYTGFEAEVIDDDVRVTATCTEETSSRSLERTWLVRRDSATGGWKLLEADMTLGGSPYEFPVAQKLDDAPRTYVNRVTPSRSRRGGDGFDQTPEERAEFARNMQQHKKYQEREGERMYKEWQENNARVAAQNREMDRKAAQQDPYGRHTRTTKPRSR